MDKIGGRKFTLALLSGLSASVLCWLGKITPDAYVAVMQVVSVAYGAANVTQKVFAK